jgi:hypothetical protein
MAVYSVSTNAQQEFALDNILPIINAQRVAQGLPTVTKPQLVQVGLDAKISDYREAFLQERKAPIIPALDTASPGEITLIKTILGL